MGECNTFTVEGFQRSAWFCEVRRRSFWPDRVHASTRTYLRRTSSIPNLQLDYEVARSPVGGQRPVPDNPQNGSIVWSKSDCNELGLSSTF